MIDRFGKTFEGGYFWLGAAHIPFVPGTPRLGVPVTGKGLRIDRIFAPSIAQKITIDLEALGMPQYGVVRSEEHTSELQSLMRISYAVFCLKKKKKSEKQNYY